MQGIDPTPLLSNPEGTLREYVCSELLGRVMVRDDRLKYVHYQDGSAELYDLQEDPTEENNLAADPGRAPQVAPYALLVEHALGNDAGRAVTAQVPAPWHRDWGMRNSPRRAETPAPGAAPRAPGGQARPVPPAARQAPPARPQVTAVAKASRRSRRCAGPRAGRRAPGERSWPAAGWAGRHGGRFRSRAAGLGQQGGAPGDDRHPR